MLKPASWNAYLIHLFACNIIPSFIPFYTQKCVTLNPTTVAIAACSPNIHSTREHRVTWRIIQSIVHAGTANP